MHVNKTKSEGTMDRLQAAIDLANSIRHKQKRKHTHPARKGPAIYAMRKRKKSMTQIKCAMCGRMCEPKNIEIDHIIPVSLGGTGDDHNLQFACHRCNTIKHYHKQSSIPPGIL